MSRRFTARADIFQGDFNQEIDVGQELANLDINAQALLPRLQQQEPLPITYMEGEDIWRTTNVNTRVVSIQNPIRTSREFVGVSLPSTRPIVPITSNSFIPPPPPLAPQDLVVNPLMRVRIRNMELADIPLSRSGSGILNRRSIIPQPPPEPAPTSRFRFNRRQGAPQPTPPANPPPENRAPRRRNRQ